MGRDIRKMMKDHVPESSRLDEGHEMRFAKKLQQSFPKKNKKPSFFWLKVAATVVLSLGAGYFAYQSLNDGWNEDSVLVQNDAVDDAEKSQFTLGDLSPDLKKVEEFYTTGINVQLASLKIDPENKELIDAYMKRLNELNTEYEKLNKELNEVGPTEATITALIDNLKLRLELLFKLKNKLKELKQLENEQFSNSTA
jgi:archaellum component FlaC